VAVPNCRLVPARSSAFAVDVEAESAGRLAEAIPLYQQALADSVRVLGKDHPNTLAMRNNLADAYRSASRRPICSRHSTFAHLLGHKQPAIAGAEKLTWRRPSRVRHPNVPICVLN